jgi:biopolymer transport protein ExbD
MSNKNKSPKINIFLVVSIFLCLLFFYIITTKLTFIYKQVESVLEEKSFTQSNQKSYDVESLKNLKEKLPLE